MRLVRNTEVAFPMSTCLPSHSTHLKRKPHPTNKSKINLMFYYGDWQLQTSKSSCVPQAIGPESQQE